MKITFKWFDGRYTQQSTTEAERLKTYKGHDIYKGSEGWLYICINGDWNYFGTIREAQKYIRDLYTE
jgi:hypothetical protein